jgi:hypothetical protein
VRGPVTEIPHCHIAELNVRVGNNEPSTVDIRLLTDGVDNAGTVTRLEDVLTNDGTTTFNRPGEIARRSFRVKVGGVTLIRGWAELIQEKHVGTRPTSYLFKGTDRSGVFYKKSYVSAIPYDGQALNAPFSDTAKCHGYDPAAFDVPTDTYLLPYTPGVSQGEYSIFPDDNTTPGEFLAKIKADHASNYYMGFVPNVAAGVSSYSWRFKNLAPSGVLPAFSMILYECMEDARDNASPAATWTHRFLGSYERQFISPEANQLLVIGQEPHTRRIIGAQWDDTSSQDAALTHSTRPKNWLGDIVRAKIENNGITTRQSAVRAASTLGPRLAKYREIHEQDANILIRHEDDRPLWIGDVVRVVKKAPTVGANGYDEYVIIKIPEMRFIEGDRWKCAYSLEKVSADPTGTTIELVSG